MTKLRPYASYSDSGVPWIGKIPETWRTYPIRAVALVRNGATPDSKNQDYWDGDIPWFTPSDLDFDVVTRLTYPKRYISAAGYRSCATNLSPPGSVIVSTRAPVGNIGITTTESTTNQGCRTLTPKGGITPSFLASALMAARDELNLRSNGTTFLELSTDSIKSIKLPIPSQEEVEVICSFLDRETARIDTLIAKKTRFIELLKEKRQAVITKAVTKGLDDSVEMKDSGADWIGKTPSHWSVGKLKHLGKLKGGSGFPIEIQGQQGKALPFYKVGDLAKSRDGVSLTDAEHTISLDEANSLGATTFSSGSIAWAKIGAALSLNRRRIIQKPCCLDNNMTGFTPYPARIGTKYAFYLTSSLDFSSHAKPGAVPSFSEGDQAKLPVVFPPLWEQETITEFIDKVTNRIDLLIEKTERSIELLKEHRAALITAAVTGKIDVREAA